MDSKASIIKQVPEPAANARRTVAILTLGCKLNLADSEALARQLAAHGCRVTDLIAPADAFIINTCTVTQAADHKARRLVRQTRRLAPSAKIILTGCYADSAGIDRAIRETGADLALPNRDKPHLVQRLLALWQENEDGCYAPPMGYGLRTRSFISVQEGCNDICAFCIVPRVRGRERSMPIKDVVTMVQARQAEGVQEVVLTGTQLGAYGRDLALTDELRQLIAAVLANTDIPRIRISSLQPQHINEALLRLWQNRRLCRHFHLALQSGSDAILTRMRRRYNRQQFLAAVELIRRHVPDVAITTDILVGFPGETEDDFQQTLLTCREAAFTAIHVFPYSQRPGTAAALIKDSVSPPAKRERVQQAQALADELSVAFRRGLHGQTLSVLWEECYSSNGNGSVRDAAWHNSRWRGLTDNYVRAYACSDTNLHNCITPVRLGEPVDDGVWGDLITI